MKLLRVIIEGQLYLAGILAIFVAEFAFLLWGLWSRRPIIGLVAVFVTVPLIRSTVSAIRACFFRIPAPEGMPLGRSEGRALYDLVEEIRRAVDAPPVDSITITGGFNASAAVYLPPWRIRRRRTLVVGLPVLTTLSVAELARRHCTRARAFLERVRSVRGVGLPDPSQLVCTPGIAEPKAGDSRVRVLAHSLVCATAERGLGGGRAPPRARG